MSESEKESTRPNDAAISGIPKSIRFAVPILSIIVILTFAGIPFLPADTSSIPVESTFFFIPLYLTIVILLVFASMYLFKALTRRNTRLRTILYQKIGDAAEAQGEWRGGWMRPVARFLTFPRKSPCRACIGVRFLAPGLSEIVSNDSRDTQGWLDR